MTFILSILLIAVGSYFVQLYLPWYAVAAFPFIIALIMPKKGIAAFFSGFLAIGFLWGILAYLIHFQTDGILTDRIAHLFRVNKSGLVILITAIVGGMVGGFWSLAGYFARRIFIRKKKKTSRYEFS